MKISLLLPSNRVLSFFSCLLLPPFSPGVQHHIQLFCARRKMPIAYQSHSIDEDSNSEVSGTPRLWSGEVFDRTKNRFHSTSYPLYHSRYMSMKSNLVSPTTLASNAPRSRSTPVETKAKIIERVRSGGTPAQFSTTGQAFNWTTFEVNNFSVENTNNNADETSKSQHTQETDDVSWPSITASNSNDSESLFGEDSYITNNEQYSEAIMSELSGFESNFTDAILDKNVVTNINDPGVGFTKCAIADTTFTVDMNDSASADIYPKKKKKVSFDENNICVWQFECNETTSLPNRRKLFHCGYSEDLIDDLGDTLRQILSFRSNFRNVRRHTSEHDDFREDRPRSSFDSVDENESDDNDDNSIIYREQIPRNTNAIRKNKSQS